jgi:predicted nucleotidyltransferase
MTANDASGVIPENIREALRATPEVEFAVAFGSRITGDARPASDLDIAVKFVDDRSARERFRQLCHLSGHLHHGDDVDIDVSDIETLPIEIVHAAVNGTLICGSEPAFHAFRDTIESEFEDRKGKVERRRRDRIRRIAEKGLHG